MILDYHLCKASAKFNTLSPKGGAQGSPCSFLSWLWSPPDSLPQLNPLSSTALSLACWPIIKPRKACANLIGCTYR